MAIRIDYSTIQAVYDYRQPVALEVVVKEWKLIPGSEIYLVTVADNISYMVLDMYMHPKFNQWLSQARPSLQNKDPLLRVMDWVGWKKLNYADLYLLYIHAIEPHATHVL